MPLEELPGGLPNPAFRFTVEIDGEVLAAFTECTMPNIEWDVEEVKEGGLNVYVHQLPGMRKSGRISLKYGICQSDLITWYTDCMSESFSRKPVTVKLLNALLEPVFTWSINDCYPLKLTAPQMKTDGNAMAIFGLELSCGEITLEAQ